MFYLNQISARLKAYTEIFSNLTIKKLRQTGSKFARARQIAPVYLNTPALSKLLSREKRIHLQQIRRTAIEYWSLGKTRKSHSEPVNGQKSEFAPSLIEWRRLQMSQRANLAQAEKGAWRLLSRIAETIDNPSLLGALARHECAHVRAAVADNVHTYLETLTALSADEDADVRYAVAENHNIPLAILAALAEDENPYVASRSQRTVSRLTRTEVHVGNFEKFVHEHRRTASR